MNMKVLHDTPVKQDGMIRIAIPFIIPINREGFIREFEKRYPQYEIFMSDTNEDNVYVDVSPSIVEEVLKLAVEVTKVRIMPVRL